MKYQPKLSVHATSHWLLNQDSFRKIWTHLINKNSKVLFTIKNKKMEKNLQELSNAKNEMVTNGQILDAAEKYFASNIKTIDFDGTVAKGKQVTLKNLNEFVGSIQKVNKIE